MPVIRLPLIRRLTGYVLAPLLTAVLAILSGQLSPVTNVLAFVIEVIEVIAVALAGGLAPAVVGAITGSLLVSFGFLLPVRTITGAVANDAAVLGVLIAVAVAAVNLNRYPRSLPEGNEHGTAH